MFAHDKVRKGTGTSVGGIWAAQESKKAYATCSSSTHCGATAHQRRLKQNGPAKRDDVSCSNRTFARASDPALGLGTPRTSSEAKPYGGRERSLACGGPGGIRFPRENSFPNASSILKA